MSLYKNWFALAQEPRNQEEQRLFWEEYFDAEKENYAKILQRIKLPYEGKLSDLAREFDMNDETFIGFLDGINESLAAGEYDLETIEADSQISLRVDPEKLYYNMLDAKADWLYGLPEWDSILSEAEREEISHRFRQDKVFIAEKHPGRNDKCSCGSGKKYKNCCGKKQAVEA